MPQQPPKSVKTTWTGKKTNTCPSSYVPTNASIEFFSIIRFSNECVLSHHWGGELQLNYFVPLRPFWYEPVSQFHVQAANSTDLHDGYARRQFHARFSSNSFQGATSLIYIHNSHRHRLAKSALDANADFNTRCRAKRHIQKPRFQVFEL